MIAIIDYAAGNLTSVERALTYIGLPSVITADPSVIRKADRIIFPGVGHARSAMTTLKERGLDKILAERYSAKTPILGICLGTQIILSHSEEGDTSCLGLIDGSVKKFVLSDPALKIPHIGWNSIAIKKPHPLLRDVAANSMFYFVHSFYPNPSNTMHIAATCSYEIEFAAALTKDNLFAVQFHPEKSGPTGLQILRNFADWSGSC